MPIEEVSNTSAANRDMQFRDAAAAGHHSAAESAFSAFKFVNQRHSEEAELAPEQALGQAQGDSALRKFKDGGIVKENSRPSSISSLSSPAGTSF